MNEASAAVATNKAVRKAELLRQRLSSLNTVIVAYSGGADSAYLAYVAHCTLGSGALAITADSPSYPERHRRMAIEIAATFGFTHQIIRTGELDQPEYRSNPTNRCYHCKHELYSHLARIAAERGAIVVDGNNADDRGDYRPGREAAREFGVRSPLDEADLSKPEIRELSYRAQLPTWDEPASACLSSRIPYHNEVTAEKLRRIERAEDLLRELGFRLCRVRHYDDHARVEIGADELARALNPEMAVEIVRRLEGAGYGRITIDPRGYRTGSLNEGVVLTPVVPDLPDLATAAAGLATARSESRASEGGKVGPAYAGVSPYGDVSRDSHPPR